MLYSLPKSAFPIREIAPGDIDAVSRLAARVWHAHYPSIVSVEQIDYMLEKMSSPAAIARQVKEGQRYFLIFENDRLLGYVGCVPRGANAWYIDKFYIDMNEHGKGLGGALLAEAKKVLNAKTFTLRVNRKNFQAINFYFKHGFFIEALDVLELDHGFIMDDFLMRWDG